MWTMDELVERVSQALAGEYPGAPNGRVRDVPDRRAIRWYATIGLVDRPLGMRGRTALYGPRHLQQLVAIKRRQAEGRSLAQIQAEFAWLSPEGLTDAAQVPEQLLAGGEQQEDLVADDPTASSRPRFWADAPASTAMAGTAPAPAVRTQVARTQVATAQPGSTQIETASVLAEADTAGVEPVGRPVGAAPIGAAPVHGVMLGGGAILLLPRPVPDRDRAALAAAAAPLVDLLQSRGLIDGRSS